MCLLHEEVKKHCAPPSGIKDTDASRQDVGSRN